MKTTMEQDILRPESTPKPSSQAFSPLGCALAAGGAAVLTFCLLGAAAAASAWALSRLIGLPDILMYGLLILLMLPVAAASFWIGGRAWAVERMLARGADVSPPVFSLGYYFKAR
jgi:hypothetical protein